MIVVLVLSLFLAVYLGSAAWQGERDYQRFGDHFEQEVGRGQARAVVRYRFPLKIAATVALAVAVISGLVLVLL